MTPAKLALVLITALGFVGPAFAESRKIAGGNLFTKKFSFFYQTFIDPSSPDIASSRLGFGVMGMTDGVHRFMMDRERKKYFGYDIAIEPLAELNTYRVTFNPLSMSANDLRSTVGDITGWTQLPTPGWAGPTSRTVRGGEVVALTILTSTATGQSITDYITVQEPRPAVTFDNVRDPERTFAFAPGPARDFRVDDVEMRLQAPRLSINGNLDPTTMALNTDVSGPIVWFYVANRGRFLLSITPQTKFGFRKAGEIRGTTLNFTIGNDTFNIVTGSPIAPGDAAFNLYVLHDPTWKPAYAFADLSRFSTGAAESPVVLLGKNAKE